MYKYIDTVKKFICYIIFIICITVILSMAITKHHSDKATIFGYKPFFIMSGSMEPTIHTHQFVIAVPITPDKIKVGDIVTYDLHSTLNRNIKETIIHRVIAINDDDTFVFKGDNNAEPDEPVRAQNIGYKIIRY